MRFFAVHYTYSDDADAVAATRPAHRAYLGSLVAAGSLRASGPYPGAQPDSALLIFAGDSADEVRALLAADPIAPLVVRADVIEWKPLLGVFAGEVSP